MKTELKDFGLTENEIKTYLTLLKMGSTNPSKLSEQTGFSRPYVYDVLERLIEKQIVSTIIKDNKKQYAAVDPNQLVEIAKQKTISMENIIPDLLKMQATEKEDVSVNVHRGKYVYKILINDILTNLKKGDEVLAYGIDDETLENLDPATSIYLSQYLTQINKLKIKERLISKEGSAILPESKTTEYRFLPENVIGETAFEVYGDKVAIFLWKDPRYLIIINSKQAADSYRKQFEMLWKQARSKPKGTFPTLKRVSEY